ncbi:cell division protein ZapA [Erythrobacter donghaensis]|jgi:cell division protein ZapA|uniref:cell division protein ZapA n=1 Tax=Erythrobacter donghaensis TaxID=267135 RepID=UPI00093B8920|nr:cell division protein ZapA [Erythrobacter donghaensis]
MSTVTLSIGPKTYQVACADGQEAHIKALGEMIAEKYAQLGSARAPLEAQNLVFAGLFLADELDQARKRLADIAQPAPAPEPDTAEPDTAELDAARETIARLEAELAEAREAAASAAAAPVAPEPPAPSTATAAVPQFDLFGGSPAASAADAELAARLEALAAAAEASAAALEAAAASA